MDKSAEIKIYRSNQQLVWLLVIHSLALVLFFSLSIPVFIQLLLTVVVLFAGATLIQQWAKFIDLCLVCREQRWVVNHKGVTEEVELRNWWSFGRLLVLRFNGRRSLVLFPDALDDSGYSLLRQKLQFQ